MVEIRRCADKEEKMITLYFMEIDDRTDSSILQEFLPLISQERQQRISRMKYEADKKLSVYAEMLVRAKACSALSVRNQDIQMAVNVYGKPYIINAPTFHFNISHTRNALVAVIGDTPLGVDIEKMNKANPDVAGKVFTANEYAYVFSNDDSKDIRFNEIWTKKESYIKWTGEGWSFDPLKIDVLSDPVVSQFTIMEIREYVVSICSATMNKYPEIIQISESELLENVNCSIVHAV